MSCNMAQNHQSRVGFGDPPNNKEAANHPRLSEAGRGEGVGGRSVGCARAVTQTEEVTLTGAVTVAVTPAGR